MIFEDVTRGSNGIERAGWSIPAVPSAQNSHIITRWPKYRTTAELLRTLGSVRQSFTEQ